MNLRDDPRTFRSDIAAIGEPLLRSEDPKLLRGEGRYTDDLQLPDQAYCVMLRSRNGHGVIRSINTEAARGMPGVLAVYTGADLAGYGPLKSSLPFKSRDGSDMRHTGRPALTTDKVRFVGDPIACVIAETVNQGRDAAEAIEVEIDPLPAVTEPPAAVASGAPQLYDDAPGNLALDFHYGDAEKVAAAFAAAAHVAKVQLVNSRVVVNTMEPRAALGAYDAASGRWTLHTGSQGVMGMRAQLAFVLGAPPEKVHVLTGNVGGSFGMKAAVYPEYVCVLHAARALGRPVKWTDDRSGSFLSDNHGRDHLQTAELALDAEGHFLALRLTGFANLGAYMGTMAPQPPTLNTVRNAASLYRTPLIEVSTRCVFTNTTFVNPYRGAGRPEGNYFMERVIDVAAAEMGIDRVELAKAQPDHAARAALHGGLGADLRTRAISPPCSSRRSSAPTGRDLRRASARRRSAAACAASGVGCYLEVTAPANKEMGGVRFEQDGTVTIVTGTLDYGQGHATPFAQVLSQKLGIPFDRIRLLQGDSDQLLAGGGTGGSRSMMNSGGAIVEAAAKVVEQGKIIASHVLETAVADIEFADGRFTIAGTDRGIGIMDSPTSCARERSSRPTARSRSTSAT